MQKLKVGQALFVLFMGLSFCCLSWGNKEPLEATILRLNQSWAGIHYGTMADSQREKQLRKLLDEAKALEQNHPDRAEPLIMEGLVLSSLAGVASYIDSLFLLSDAKSRLEKAIKIDAGALRASAQITLGALYHCVPVGVSFGDDDKAQSLFGDAIKRQPKALDANFYLGAFLLEEGDFDKAIPYLKVAAFDESELVDDIEKHYIKKRASVLLVTAQAHRIAKQICYSVSRIN